MDTNAKRSDVSVFISVGHNLTPDEDHFVQLIKNYLKELGIEPLLIERQEQMMSEPVEAIRNVIHKCAGTIVIAIERYRVLEALEFPKSSTPIHLPVRSQPTVWNQIEAAMTLQSQKPLLILGEHGLTPDGLIDPLIHPITDIAITSLTVALPQGVIDALAEWCRRL